MGARFLNYTVFVTRLSVCASLFSWPRWLLAWYLIIAKQISLWENVICASPVLLVSKVSRIYFISLLHLSIFMHLSKSGFAWNWYNFALFVFFFPSVSSPILPEEIRDKWWYHEYLRKPVHLDPTFVISQLAKELLRSHKPTFNGLNLRYGLFSTY